MPAWNLKQHCGEAKTIITENTIVIWWVVLIGLLSSATLLLKDTTLFWPLNVAVTALSIFSTPIIYGIYFELIEDTYSSIPAIARTYIPGYIWLIIRMYLPPIFLASMLISLARGNIENFGGGGILETTLVLFSLIYLFVIPCYYRRGTGNGAIGRGLAFLFNNLAGATPLILAVLLLETSMLLLQYQRAIYSDQSSLLFIALDFVVFVIASLIDYAIFIVLTLVLKEHNPSMDSAA